MTSIGDHQLIELSKRKGVLIPPEKTRVHRRGLYQFYEVLERFGSGDPTHYRDIIGWFKTNRGSLPTHPDGRKVWLDLCRTLGYEPKAYDKTPTNDPLKLQIEHWFCQHLSGDRKVLINGIVGLYMCEQAYNNSPEFKCAGSPAKDAFFGPKAAKMQQQFINWVNTKENYKLPSVCFLQSTFANGFEEITTPIYLCSGLRKTGRTRQLSLSFLKRDQPDSCGEDDLVLPVAKKASNDTDRIKDLEERLATSEARERETMNKLKIVRADIVKILDRGLDETMLLNLLQKVSEVTESRGGLSTLALDGLEDEVVSNDDEPPEPIETTTNIKHPQGISTRKRPVSNLEQSNDEGSDGGNSESVEGVGSNDVSDDAESPGPVAASIHEGSTIEDMDPTETPEPSELPSPALDHSAAAVNGAVAVALQRTLESNATQRLPSVVQHRGTLNKPSPINAIVGVYFNPNQLVVLKVLAVGNRKRGVGYNVIVTMTFPTWSKMGSNNVHMCLFPDTAHVNRLIPSIDTKNNFIIVKSLAPRGPNQINAESVPERDIWWRRIELATPQHTASAYNLLPCIYRGMYDPPEILTLVDYHNILLPPHKGKFDPMKHTAIIMLFEGGMVMRFRDSDRQLGQLEDLKIYTVDLPCKFNISKWCLGTSAPEVEECEPTEFRFNISKWCLEPTELATTELERPVPLALRGQVGPVCAECSCLLPPRPWRCECQLAYCRPECMTRHWDLHKWECVCMPVPRGCSMDVSSGDVDDVFETEPNCV